MLQPKELRDMANRLEAHPSNHIFAIDAVTALRECAKALDKSPTITAATVDTVMARIKRALIWGDGMYGDNLRTPIHEALLAVWPAQPNNQANRTNPRSG